MHRSEGQGGGAGRFAAFDGGGGPGVELSPSCDDNGGVSRPSGRNELAGRVGVLRRHVPARAMEVEPRENSPDVFFRV